MNLAQMVWDMATVMNRLSEEEINQGKKEKEGENVSINELEPTTKEVD